MATPRLASAFLVLGGLWLLDGVPLVGQTALVQAVGRRHLGGVTPTGPTQGIVLTPDGRFLLADSEAPDVVPGQLDSNGTGDAFLHDRFASGSASTLLVSAVPGSAVRAANNRSYPLDVSNDGRYVLFRSLADDLVAQGLDTNGTSDLFLRDVQLGETHVVNHRFDDPNRPASPGWVEVSGLLSSDGRFVAFGSSSPDVVGGFEQNASYDVYLYDRSNASVSLVSRAVGEPTIGAGPGLSLPKAISSDGRYVLFESTATNLIPGYVAASSDQQVFRFDRTTGLSRLVSRAHGTTATSSNGASQAFALSADGRWALIGSRASDLLAVPDLSGHFDVFLADLETGTVLLVSHEASSLDTGANGSSFPRFLSSDGRFVVFESLARNLILGSSDLNDSTDVFLFDRTDGRVRLVSRSALSPTRTAAGSSFVTASAEDGSQVVFTSSAADIAGFDSGFGSDVFIWHSSTGTVTLASTTRGSTSFPASLPSCCGLISADGGVLIFSSYAPELDPPDRNTGLDVFEPTGTPGFVSAAIRREGSVATTGPRGSAVPAMSRDGRFFLLSAAIADLLPGTSTGLPGAFVYDRFGERWDFVSHAHGAPTAPPDRSSSPVALSNSGRWVLFDSSATNLIPGYQAAIETQGVYRYDRQTREALLVSHAAGAVTTAANGGSTGHSISDDGRWIVLTSSATDLITGQSGGLGPHLFLYDAVSRTSWLVDRTSSSATIGSGGTATFSDATDDGRFVLFTATGDDLVEGDGNKASDVFVFDRATTLNEVHSVQAGSPSQTGSGASQAVAISRDGRFVVFSSLAPNLVDGISDLGWKDVFLRDRVLGATSLLSHDPTGTSAGDADSTPAALTDDGRFVLLETTASNLVPQGSLTGITFGQVLLYDRVLGQARLVSHAAGMPSVPGSGNSSPVAISDNGRHVIFNSSATNLGWASGPSAFGQVYSQDMVTGWRRLLSPRESDPSVPVGTNCYASLISEDGNSVIFSSFSGELVVGDTNRFIDAFLASTALLSDGFESGDTSRWSVTVPPLP